MKKYNLTNEELKTLYSYEEMFTKALTYDYISGVLKQDFDKVKEIYVRLTGSQETLNIGCSYCVIKLFKSMGEIYYEFRKNNKESESTES